eukprot:799867-Prymnesium_polylepis.1
MATSTRAGCRTSPHHRPGSSSAARHADALNALVPRALRGDQVTTVVDDLLEDSVMQSLVPWLFVETVQSAPCHIAYMLLDACTVNDTSPLRDRSAR